MISVGILLFDQIELLDFAGPYEVFTTASRVAARRNLPAPFYTRTIAKSRRAITARAGLQVQPDLCFDDHHNFDLLIVPGGVVDQVQQDPQHIQWLREQRHHCDCIASICTGAFLLAQAGLAEDLPLTTHWEDLEDLAQQFPAQKVVGQCRFIDHGHLASSAGIAAGIDLSLHLVGRLVSQELAWFTARQMDYPWLPDNAEGARHELF